MTNITLSAPASPAGWRVALQTETPVLPSTHLSVTVTAGNGFGVVVRKLEGSNEYWLVGIDASNKAIVSKYNGTAYTTVAASTQTFSASTYRIEVQFSENRFGSDIDMWNSVTMWVNGRFAIHYTERVTSIITVPCYFGLAVLAGNTRTFSNLRIPQLSEAAEICTIDPGENPLSAMSRTLDGRFIKYYLRADGTFRAWKPRRQDSVHIIDDVEAFTQTWNPHTIKTHIRMVGAWELAEHIDPDLMAKYGDRFIEINNPYLMSENECLYEAKRALLRIREQALTGSYTTSIYHFLEIEDRVTTPEGDRVVNSFSVDHTAPQAVQQIGVRDYVYG